MASILKVDTLQKPDGSTPTAADLGLSKAIVKYEDFTFIETTDADFSTGSWVTVHSYTFTPDSSDSLLVVDGILAIRPYRDNGADARIQARLRVNGGTYWKAAGLGVYDYGGSGTWVKLTIPMKAHFPNTTGSAVTIETQVYQDSSRGVATYTGDTQSLTVTEISN